LAVLLPDSPFRQMLAWWFQFLFVLSGVLVMVVCLWFFSGLPGSATRVREFQGLVLLAGALGVLVIGVSVVVLFLLEGVFFFLPLGLGSVGVAFFIAGWGLRVLRSRRR
jgi:hypothetical protein